MSQWALVAAACVCMVLGGAWIYFFNVPFVWNEDTVSVSASDKMKETPGKKCRFVATKAKKR